MYVHCQILNRDRWTANMHEKACGSTSEKVWKKHVGGRQGWQFLSQCALIEGNKAMWETGKVEKIRRKTKRTAPKTSYHQKAGSAYYMWEKHTTQGTSCHRQLADNCACLLWKFVCEATAYYLRNKQLLLKWNNIFSLKRSPYRELWLIHPENTPHWPLCLIHGKNRACQQINLSSPHFIF